MFNGKTHYTWPFSIAASYVKITVCFHPCRKFHMESPLQARGCVLYAANSNRAVDVAAEAKRRRNEIERNLAKKHEECILTD